MASIRSEAHALEDFAIIIIYMPESSVVSLFSFHIRLVSCSFDGKQTDDLILSPLSD